MKSAGRTGAAPAGRHRRGTKQGRRQVVSRRRLAGPRDKETNRWAAKEWTGGQALETNQDMDRWAVKVWTGGQALETNQDMDRWAVKVWTGGRAIETADEVGAYCHGTETHHHALGPQPSV